MRLLLLALAVVLVGCPATDPPASGDETQDPFSDVYKSKQPSSTPEAAQAPVVEPSTPEATPAATPVLVAVGRQATVRDPEDTFLHLRAGPSSRSASVAQMPNGSAVRIEACREGTVGRRWCQVAFNGRDGWAFEGGLALVARPDSPREVAAARAATINDPDGWTNLRTSASTRSEIITRLINGSGVTVKSCIPAQNGSSSRWCDVDAFTVTDGAQSGWVAESRLRYN